MVSLIDFKNMVTIPVQCLVSTCRQNVKLLVYGIFYVFVCVITYVGVR